MNHPESRVVVEDQIKPQRVAEIPYRDGFTYDPPRDGQRLDKQHVRVRNLMLDSKWRSLSQIARETGDPEASVSARIRDLRKPRFGSYLIERRYVSRGLWEYKLLVGQLELT